MNIDSNSTHQGGDDPPHYAPGGVGPAPKNSPDPYNPALAASNHRLLGILLGLVLLVLAATYLSRTMLFGVLFHL